jgi:hypothetical protein
MTARFLFRDWTTSCLSAWLRFDALIGFSSKIPSITSPRAHAIGGGFWIESTSTMPLFSLGYAPKIVEFGSAAMSLCRIMFICCRLRPGVYVRVLLDEVFQERDLENPNKRDFFCTSLAEGLFRSCHSITGILRSKVALPKRESCESRAGEISGRPAVWWSNNRSAFLKKRAVIDRAYREVPRLSNDSQESSTMDAL